MTNVKARIKFQTVFQQCMYHIGSVQKRWLSPSDSYVMHTPLIHDSPQCIPGSTTATHHGSITAKANAYPASRYKF